jgi:methyl-accepting chemotaxis protein
MDSSRINRKKKSFAGRITSAMILAGLVIVAVVLTITYFAIRSYLMEEIEGSAAAFATAAANHMDGDLFEQIGEGDEDSEAFMEAYNTLLPFLDVDDVSFVYAMRESENGEMTFVVDTDPDDPAAIGEVYDEAVPEMFDVLSTGESLSDTDVTTDEWGSFLSGYAPIKNSAGKVVGLVGIDYSASIVTNDCRSFLKQMILIGVLCVASSLVVGLIISGQLKKRLKMVNDKLADIVYNDGDLDRKIEIYTGDEFEDIADNINAMMDQTRDIVSNVQKCSGKIHNVAANVDETMGEARDKVQTINDYMEEMSGGIEMTVESVESIREMMAEVEASVNEVAQSSKEGSRVASEISERSDGMKKNALKSQKAINEQIADIRVGLDEQLKKARSAEKIQSFTEDILNIADETQMLSLNASIEAARAGDAGRGFSVVAESIGKLAISSGEAAENIQQVSVQVMDVVDNLSALSKHIVGFIEEELLPEFEDLTQSSEQYVEYAGRISSIMSQFEERMGQVDKAVEDVQEAVLKVAEASETNKDHVQEVSEYAGNLNRQMGHTVDMSQMNKEQADNLSKVVERFKLS